MKKLFLIPLLALFTCVNMWAAQTAVNLSVGSGQTYETVSAALASVSTDGKINANQNITITLTSNVTEASAVTIDLSNGKAIGSKINVNLALGGYTLTGAFSLSGGGSTSYCQVAISNGTLNGSFEALNTKIKLTLNYSVGGTISLSNFSSSTLALSGSGNALLSANISLNNVSFKIPANKTFTGNFTVNGDTDHSYKTLTIEGTYTGAITFVENNAATLYMNNAAAAFLPSNKTGVPGTYTLRAGTVNFDPNSVLEEAYEAVANGTNPETWTIQTATNAVRIGETEYKTFALAYEAAAENATLELLKDCKITADANLTKAFITTGDFDLIVDQNATVQFNSASTIAHLAASGNVVVGGATINMASLSIANGKSFTLNSGAVTVTNAIGLSGALTISGGSLTAPAVNLNASTASFTMSAGTLNGNVATPGATGTYNTINISGGTINGAINITHYGTNLAIGGVTVVSTNAPALRSMATNNLTISSGSYTNNGEGEVVEGGNGSYKLTLQGGTYNKQPNAAYIPEGYEAVQSGDNWVVQAAAAEFVSVSKNGGAAQSFSNMSEFIAYLPLANDGSTYTITLLRDYSMDFGEGLEVYSTNTCTLDLNGHQLTASSNDNKSKLLVGGTLILNANGGSIVIPNDNGISVLNGGKATINGGTFTTNEYNSTAFYADAEGKLTINGATINATVGCAIRSKGNAIVKNTTITSACNAMYAVINAGNMSLISTNVTGNHGAVACIEEAGTLDIDGGVFRAVNQELSDAYAALYVATSSLVSAKGAKFYSDRENYAVLSGDNDSGKTFGIVNLYNNCYLSDKMHVSERKVSTAEVAFPVQLAESSAWYSSFGGEGPLPAGYEYRAIINEGEPTAEQVLDAEAYSEGYRWKVVSTAAKQEEASGTTIPWQRNTTWTDTETPSVPDENTAVVIPEGKTVVVANSESDKTAEANQVNIASNASLTIEENTSLTITNGINIANGGSLKVNEGGTVIVGAGGIISSDETTIVLTSSEDSHSTLLLDPDVKENTQPKATFVFHSKAKQKGNGKCDWQRFGIPTFDGITTMSWADGVKTAIFSYDYEAKDWKLEHDGYSSFTTTAENGRPFQCYDMTIDGTEEIDYTFVGNLMGNANAPLDFVFGWNYYANSYTAPIDIESFINDIIALYGEVSATVYVYRRSDNWWDEVNLTNVGDDDIPTKINPMQAFILQLRGAESSDAQIDFEHNIYDPIVAAMTSGSSHAPKAVRESDFNKVVITATNGVESDKLTLFEKSDLSDAFDNGYDAEKYVEAEKSFSIYHTEDGVKLGTYATNDLSDKFIAFDAKVEGEYTLNFSNAKGDEISLYDAVADSTIIMKAGESYTFHAEAINDAERFIINANGAPSAIEDVQNVVNATKFIGIDGQLYIRRAGNVYDVQGKEVK